MRPLMLSFFDYSGIMAIPWARAGIECWCIDLKHEGTERKEGNILYIADDVLQFKPPQNRHIVFQAYFPPCTHFAVSGARYFKEKGLDALIESLILFNMAVTHVNKIDAPYIIENPVSTVSTYYRQPDFTFHPFEYAGYLPVNKQQKDAYTKKTCLWTGKGFKMPVKKPVQPALGSYMHTLPPSENRAELRSNTPNGFSQAVFEFNWRKTKCK